MTRTLRVEPGAIVAWLRRPYPAAIAVYLAVRLVGVAVLALMADEPLVDRLTAWDGLWYLDLAEQGYDGITDRTDANGRIFVQAPMAFFPLYPGLTSVVAQLPGVSTTAAALTLSASAGVALACGLVRLGRLADPRPRVGLLLVTLVAGAPMAITLSMAYTEALFMAFAVWALVGVIERNWWLAGISCLFAGFTRSTATALVLVVVLAAGYAVYRNRDRGAALACVLLAPLGLFGFWTWGAVRTGVPTGWWDIERIGWNTGFDFGQAKIEWIGDTLDDRAPLMDVAGVAVLLGVVALVVVAVANRLPWQLTVYAAGVLVIVAGSSGIPAATPRFLLPAFPVLLLPVAVGLANRRPRTALTVTAAVVLVSAWFSAYSLTVWEHAM